MYKNLDEYLNNFYSNVYITKGRLEYYYTQCDDPEYINGNSIIIEELNEEVIYSICELLSCSVNITHIQLPLNDKITGHLDEELSLIAYEPQNTTINTGVEYELVTSDNFEIYLELTNKLQTQEYGKVYKSNADLNYFKQSKYKMVLVKYNGVYVGEFMYIPSLAIVESIIILKEFQRKGIMRSCLELFATTEKKILYLTCDDSSCGFYRKINTKFIDSKKVTNLYGNNIELQMYLSLSI